MTKSVVFIGCGDIATRAAVQLQQQSVEVLGVRRNIAKLPGSLPSISADVLDSSSLEFLASTRADVIVYSLAAAGFNEASYTSAYITGLQNTIKAASLKPNQRLVFVSSTSVYHQNDGSQVDESSHTQPKKFNGKIMLEAEQLALNTGIATVVRFSGIYGPGRTRLIDRVRNGQCTPEDTDIYTNRIHSADCSGLLAHLAMKASLPDLLIGSDSSPATSNEVESYIADLLVIEKRYAQTGVKQAKRIAGSKRCSNASMLDTGYQLQHPTYRSGYQQLIAETS